MIVNKLHLIMCLCARLWDALKLFDRKCCISIIIAFLVVIFSENTREQGAAGNSNESVCLLPLAEAQQRRKVISKWMRGLKNWKLADKLLFSWGVKQQHDFSEDFWLFVHLSSHPFCIFLYSIMSTSSCRFLPPLCFPPSWTVSSFSFYLALCLSFTNFSFLPFFI